MEAKVQGAAVERKVKAATKKTLSITVTPDFFNQYEMLRGHISQQLGVHLNQGQFTRFLIDRGMEEADDRE